MRADYKKLDLNDTVLVTGGAGFIGFHLSKLLLEKGVKKVIGFDNLNDYYSPKLKQDRLDVLAKYDNYEFIKGDLSNRNSLETVFKDEKPTIVVNLGGQAGVRYSITHPDEYIQSNLIGFFNVLECCRNYPVKHLLYASSSSVYGANKKIPFSVEDKTDRPVSLYAATKKSNELMAYSYSHLYKIKATGLRFFTVYGPYGRPDMAYYSFTQKILKGEAINVFNNGDMYRDFTYVDDIVEAISRMVNNPPICDKDGVMHKVYNIGNNKPEKLMDYINTLEGCLGVKAKINFMPMQAGDVYRTYADVTDLMNDFDFKPSTSIKEGLSRFVEWYLKANE